MPKEVIVDADICIKLGCSEKYRFLYDILPLLADKIYIHKYTYENEILSPASAKGQLQELIDSGKAEIVCDDGLAKDEQLLYNMTVSALSKVMSDPKRPGKNKGEMLALAYAKVKGIPLFATDERDLGPIIDKVLNTGIEPDENIKCLRIVDIVNMARDGAVDISRKTAKALWVIAGKSKEVFDNEVWKITY